MIETASQGKLVARFIKLGGWSKKKSNQYTAGIPDLDVLVPGFPPFNVEVKHLGQVGVKTFKRQVETTSLQDETMKRMNAVNPHHTAAIVAVTYERGRELWVTFIPATQPHVTSEDTCFLVKTLNLTQFSTVLQRLSIYPLRNTQLPSPLY